MPEHDDLRSSLLELTEPRQAPADPAALVRHRVRGVRRRRHRAAGILVAATAAVLAAGPVTGLLRSSTDRSTVGGSSTTRPAATQAATPRPTPTYNDPALNSKLPPPWKDREYTKFPQRNLYGPQGIYLAQGELGGHNWYAVTHTADRLSEGCTAAASDDPDAPELGFDGCFDEWPAGRRANWDTHQAYRGGKPGLAPLDGTFVGGAVSAEARSTDQDRERRSVPRRRGRHADLGQAALLLHRHPAARGEGDLCPAVESGRFPGRSSRWRAVGWRRVLRGPA